MDGHGNFDGETAHRAPTSELMSFAEACLGGRKKWQGRVRGLAGLLVRRFSIESNGAADAGVLTFRETLAFDDGEVQKRFWRLTETPKGLALKSDGVTQISPGKVKNGGLVFVYRLKFGVFSFNYEDSFFMGENGEIRNEGIAKLFGVPVLKITATTTHS